MTYQKHPALVKHLVCTKQLHRYQIKTIPPSTRTYWKQQFKEDENVFDTKGIFHKTLSNHNKAIQLLLATLPKQKKKKTFWKKHLHLLTQLIDKCPTPEDKIQLLQLLQISAQAYAKWTATPYCQFSLVNLCAKKYPTQLTGAEKNIIKQYMNNPQYAFLNRTQVYWKMRNNKALLITLKTFHKYCNLMGLYSHKRKKQANEKQLALQPIIFYTKYTWILPMLGCLMAIPLLC
jgi:hypothetical protein